MIIYTIGHSNVEVDEILKPLERYGVEVVLDVRSSPYSRFAPQFNREDLAERLHTEGIEYVYAGQYLGGRPKDPSCYDQDDDSKVLYREIEKKEWYQRAIDQLIQLASEKWTAFLCAEEDPGQCHRHMLITQTLLDRDIEVRHIRHKEGQVWDELAGRELARDVEQFPMFPGE